MSRCLCGGQRSFLAVDTSALRQVSITARAGLAGLQASGGFPGSASHCSTGAVDHSCTSLHPGYQGSGPQIEILMLCLKPATH